MKEKKYLLRMPEKLHTKLKIEAATKGKTFNDLAIEKLEK